MCLHEDENMSGRVCLHADLHQLKDTDATSCTDRTGGLKQNSLWLT